MTASQTYPYGDITLWEVIPLALRFVGLGFVLVLQTFQYPFTRRKFTLRRTLWRTFVQTICPNSTLRQMQWVIPRVGILYEQFMRAQQRKLDIIHEDVGEGASLHWIGPTSSSLVMLYFHGGGYVLPAVYGHFKMVNHFRQEVRKRHDIDVSVAFLEYSLVNHAPWPQQLKQVSAAFTHLLKRGIHPSNIILVGDSVGGHEVAFLLAHILHPHPSVKPVPQLVAPLAGAAMLSPWLSFSEDAPSFARNANSDLMPTKALTKWANLFKNSRGKMDDDNWFEPGEAPAQWWNGLEKIVNNVLITTASGECMLDDIIRAGETMKKGAGSTLKIETFVEEGASHNEILAEFAAGDKPGASTEKVTKWIADVFA